MIHCPPGSGEPIGTPAAADAMPRPGLASLSAFFPVHDEEADVVPMAEALLRVLPEVAERWELIIVDDGSRDRTGQLADELSRTRPEVRVVHHPVNRGYGAAIRSGIAAARHDYVFLTDGDRQFEPTQIGRLISEVGRADVIVGYRHRRADNALRRVYGVLWNALVRRLFRLPVRDVNCAFKLIRRHVLAGIELRAEGAVVSTELVIRVLRQGRRIVEVPVDHFPRLHGQPSGGRIGVILRAWVELVRLRRQTRRMARKSPASPVAVGTMSAP